MFFKDNFMEKKKSIFENYLNRSPTPPRTSRVEIVKKTLQVTIILKTQITANFRSKLQLLQEKVLNKTAAAINLISQN